MTREESCFRLVLPNCFPFTTVLYAQVYPLWDRDRDADQRMMTLVFSTAYKKRERPAVLYG